MSASKHHTRNMINAVMVGDFDRANGAFESALNLKNAEQLEAVRHRVAKRIGKKKA
jgi:hypothetical protein